MGHYDDDYEELATEYYKLNAEKVAVCVHKYTPYVCDARGVIVSVKCLKCDKIHFVYRRN